MLGTIWEKQRTVEDQRQVYVHWRGYDGVHRRPRAGADGRGGRGAPRLRLEPLETTSPPPPTGCGGPGARTRAPRPQPIPAPHAGNHWEPYDVVLANPALKKAYEERSRPEQPLYVGDLPPGPLGTKSRPNYNVFSAEDGIVNYYNDKDTEEVAVDGAPPRRRVRTTASPRRARAATRTRTRRS